MGRQCNSRRFLQAGIFVSLSLVKQSKGPISFTLCPISTLSRRGSKTNRNINLASTSRAEYILSHLGCCRATRGCSVTVFSTINLARLVCKPNSHLLIPEHYSTCVALCKVALLGRSICAAPLRIGGLRSLRGQFQSRVGGVEYCRPTYSHGMPRFKLG